MNEFQGTFANSGATHQAPSIEEMKEIVRQGEARIYQLRRKESEMIEKMECPECGRKPTVTQDPFMGRTIHVCKHWFELLEKHVEKHPESTLIDSFNPRSLHGYNICLFDDGPRRW